MRFVGLDLAWGERARTGVALLATDGTLVRSASVRTDDEIAGFLGEDAHRTGLVAAIDAPLIVPNETGQRACEREVGRLFGRYHAGAYPANRGNRAFVPEPRGSRVAARFGWQLDPGLAANGERSVAIEVYPHPAMISLFGLERVLPYKRKRGRDVPGRQRAFAELVDHMEAICGALLRLDSSARWRELTGRLDGNPRQVDLDLVEDEVDAIFCAYLAWMWAHDRGRMLVLGDHADGYIVTPRAPTRQGGTPQPGYAVETTGPSGG